MIRPITKKQLLETRNGRKIGYSYDHLDFIAPDGKAYRVDCKGGEGLKQMVAFNKNMMLNMAQQVALIELAPKDGRSERKNYPKRNKGGVYH